jgi:hypothetical protein
MTLPPPAQNPPPLPTPHSLAAAARELLARTAELPGSKRDLMAVLSEYRAVVHAFAAAADRM